MALGTDRWRQMVDVNIKGVLNTAAAVTIVGLAVRGRRFAALSCHPFTRIPSTGFWLRRPGLTR
jgi:hypothetical protein